MKQEEIEALYTIAKAAQSNLASPLDKFKFRAVFTEEKILEIMMQLKQDRALIKEEIALFYTAPLAAKILELEKALEEERSKPKAAPAIVGVLDPGIIGSFSPKVG